MLLLGKGAQTQRTWKREGLRGGEVTTPGGQAFLSEARAWGEDGGPIWLGMHSLLQRPFIIMSNSCQSCTLPLGLEQNSSGHSWQRPASSFVLRLFGTGKREMTDLLEVCFFSFSNVKVGQVKAHSLEEDPPLHLACGAAWPLRQSPISCWERERTEQSRYPGDHCKLQGLWPASHLGWVWEQQRATQPLFLLINPTG